MARPQNCYDLAGPIQKIIVPEDLGPNDARLREFTTTCRDLAKETHRKAKVIFGRDIVRLTEAQRVVCLKTVVRTNPSPITVVSSQPSHAGLRVINKEPYKPPPQTVPPPRKTPNLNLIELLIEGYDPNFHCIREEDLADAVTRGPGTYLYCYNVSYDHLGSKFEGYLYKDNIIRASNVDPKKLLCTA
ncbi:hypothetical protein QAD02_000168 [Eretmocerus hayati]|uniref:Uncharacterized protein n=1 Tax=Eretmocerus hayati TaxID=131215 RepID=A0ACC2NCV9_9HYME|nr:hypothetical protein QAD02_000168 [Eretmocerus hayati]